jgi:hypothetical protein
MGLFPAIPTFSLPNLRVVLAQMACPRMLT